MSKYHSKKITRDGITWDSKKEYERFRELKLLERAGKIADLQRQVVFELIPSQRDPKTRKVIERACKYVADFTYWKNGEFIVEDTKGFRTADYIIKRKLMLHVHGIRIKEI
jgi:hypothetical protein